MKRAFRLGFYVCILLTVGIFAGCSDDEATTAPTPQPEPAIAGSIGIFADPAGTDRTIVDNGGSVTVYVVHKVDEGGTASAFTIEAPAGWTRVGTVSQFPIVIGDVDAGISVAYGSCLTGSIHVLTLNYTAPGNTPAGATFKVMPHPEWPDNIRVVDCHSEMLTDCIGQTSSVVVQ